MAMPAQAVTGATCTPVGQACDLTTPVIDGSNGGDAGHYKDGNPGHPGQPGGDIIADFEGPQAFVTSGPLSALQALTVGGFGGNGSNANPVGDIILKYRGGAGAPGQSGGAITISTGPAVSGQAVAGSFFGTLIMGMALVSTGGNGGNGGVASFELGQPGNGIAGVGGNGGPVTATIDGRWTSAQGTGLFVVSKGGGGGGGNFSSTSDTASPQGVDAADGGVGGSIDVTVKGTVSGQVNGAVFKSIGGDGGKGGGSTDVLDRSGGAGGNGGVGGTVTATLDSGAFATASDPGGAAFYVASLGGVGGQGGPSKPSRRGRYWRRCRTGNGDCQRDGQHGRCWKYLRCSGPIAGGSRR